MVKFYSSDHCPICKRVKGELDKYSIKYEEIADEDDYLPIANVNKIKSMPFAEIDGEILDTQKLVQWVNSKVKEIRNENN